MMRDRYLYFGIYAKPLLLAAWTVLGLMSDVTSGAAQSGSGDLTVAGNLSVAGTIDAAGNTVQFGTVSGSGVVPGLAFTYADGTAGQIGFSAARPRSVWLWQSDIAGWKTQMRLDGANTLTLFDLGSTPSAGITLNPAGASVFANSLTVNGSDSRMPYQTLADDSSVLTRQLADGRYLRLSAGGASSFILGAGASSVEDSVFVMGLYAHQANGGYADGSGNALVIGNGASGGTRALAVGNGANANDDSMAIGQGAVAECPGGLAVGNGAVAAMYGAVAIGSGSVANGNISVAVRGSTLDDYGVAIGGSAGFSATAVGMGSYAANYAAVLGSASAWVYGVALGNSASAGSYGVALGTGSSAGDYAVALGNNAYANGDYSAALSSTVTANGYAQTVLGHYNIPQGDYWNWIATDDLFQIGNGVDATHRSNAFTVKKNGETSIFGNQLNLGLLADQSAGTPESVAVNISYAESTSGGTTAGSVTFSASRSAAAWKWQQNASDMAVPQMTLSGTNVLTLYDSAGNPAIVLDPSRAGTSSAFLTQGSADARYLTLSAAGSSSLVLGFGASSVEDSVFVMGVDAHQAAGIYGDGSGNALVIGNGASGGDRSLAIGGGANAADSGVAVGQGAWVDYQGLAIGNGAGASFGSVAIGSGTQAPGIASIVVGGSVGWNDYAVAVGGYAGASSTSVGRSAYAGDYAAAFGNAHAGYYATALGNSAFASDFYTVAVGDSASAMSWGAVALGDNANANNGYSTALGYAALATGEYSIALGSMASSSGRFSVALGNNASAIGENSSVLSANASANGYAQVVIGQYNVPQGDASNWIATDDLFQIGNGVDINNPSNALTVKKNGDMTVAGNITTATGTLTAARLVVAHVDPQGDLSMGEFTAGQ